MELKSDTILRIFSNNFNFPIVDTILGKALLMDAYQAFLFANVTGAGYLDDPNYLFTPKGVTKILREAFQYNFVTGIFDRHNLYYSPYELRNKKPFIFESDKYVIFKECQSEEEFCREMKKSYELLEQNNIKTTDFMFFRIEAWKNGNGMECFLEYLACEYFKKLGYIVENQIPLVHAIGTPDFGGYKTNTKGFHLIELAMLRFTKDYDLVNDINIENIIVGEAKTATTIMAKQLEKYLNTGAFCKGYEMHPSKAAPTKDCFGMFNIDSEYKIKCVEPQAKYVCSEETDFETEEYQKWFYNYIKLYLIANFTNDELVSFVNGINPSGKYNQKKIIKTITALSINDIVNKLKECV